MNTLDAKLEAILFYKGEPQKIKNLAKLLNVTEEDIKNALDILKERLVGLELVTHEDSVTLTTAGEFGELIESLRKEELTKDLGRAGSETLSIVLYNGPVTRAEIDYIRGVNSTFILRNLLIRGLVKKVSNPKDQRSYLYKPTLELLSFLGVSKIEDLPNYQTVQRELELFQQKDGE